MRQVQASCEQAMRLWWEDYHPGWMIFTLGNQHFETLNQIIQYSQSSMIKGGLTPLQVKRRTNPLLDFLHRSKLYFQKSPRPPSPRPPAPPRCLVSLVSCMLCHGVCYMPNNVASFYRTNCSWSSSHLEVVQQANACMQMQALA